MRYEVASGSIKQLPETSASITNMDNKTAVLLRIVNQKVLQVVIYPGQSFKYVNSTAYVKSVQVNRQVQLQIKPLKTIEGSDSGEDSGYLPTSGGTIKGNLNIQGNLSLNGNRIVLATDAQTQVMLDNIFGK